MKDLNTRKEPALKSMREELSAGLRAYRDQLLMTEPFPEDTRRMLEDTTPGRELPWGAIANEEWDRAIGLLSSEINRRSGKTELAELHAYRAMANLRLDRLEDAEIDAEAAISHSTENDFAWRMHASVMDRLGHAERAEESLRRACELGE